MKREDKREQARGKIIPIRENIPESQESVNIRKNKIIPLNPSWARNRDQS